MAPAHFKEKVDVKGTRWLLLKNPWNLTNHQTLRLSTWFLATPPGPHLALKLN